MRASRYEKVHMAFHVFISQELHVTIYRGYLVRMVAENDSKKKYCCHFAANGVCCQQKSHPKRWLNYMILLLKFGGPCWV